MHETRDDLVRLQNLLDDSYAKAGEHLRSIITPDGGSRPRVLRASYRE
jgi:hypothetical protein